MKTICLEWAMSWFRVHCYKRFARKRCGMLRGRSLPAGADKRQLQACRSILQRSRGTVCPWRVRHHFYGLGGHIRLDKGAYPALFDRCFAAGLIERVPGCCPSHIHVPGYDAWTGQPASIGKVMNAAGSFPPLPPRCRQVEILRRFRRVAEGVSCLLRPHHPPAGGERQLCPRPLEKLSTRERELAYRKVEDYYFSLNNTHFCYQAAKYLEYRIFENEFVN